MAATSASALAMSSARTQSSGVSSGCRSFTCAQFVRASAQFLDSAFPPRIILPDRAASLSKACGRVGLSSCAVFAHPQHRKQTSRSSSRLACLRDGYYAEHKARAGEPVCAQASRLPKDLTSTHEVMDGLLAASRTVASIRGATGNACRMTLAARGGTSSGFLSKAISSALAGSCKGR